MLVAKFLEDLADKLAPRAERDFSLMTQMKGSPVQVWDPPYYTLEARKTLIGADRADFLPYFSLGACMEGLNLLTQNLYNIELVQDEILPGETWYGDVYKLSGMQSFPPYFLYFQKYTSRT